MLIIQHYCKIFSNYMFEHRSHTDCDLKWRCVDVHEATICNFFFRGGVTSFAPMHGKC